MYCKKKNENAQEIFRLARDYICKFPFMMIQASQISSDSHKIQVDPPYVTSAKKDIDDIHRPNSTTGIIIHRK